MAAPLRVQLDSGGKLTYQGPSVFYCIGGGQREPSGSMLEFYKQLTKLILRITDYHPQFLQKKLHAILGPDYLLYQISLLSSFSAGPSKENLQVASLCLKLKKNLCRLFLELYAQDSMSSRWRDVIESLFEENFFHAFFREEIQVLLSQKDKMNEQYCRYLCQAYLPMLCLYLESAKGSPDLRRVVSFEKLK